VRFSTELPLRIFVSCSEQNAVSALIMKDKRHVFCGFDAPFCSRDTLTVANVFDVHGVPLDTRFTRAVFQTTPLQREPYLAQATVKNRYEVELLFSEPMDGRTVTNPDNYRLEPAGYVRRVLAADSTYRQITLYLSKNSMAGGLGQAAYLSLEHILSRDGRPLGGSATINLFTAEETLDHVLVYPQPLRPQNRQLIFARLPQGTQISIFTVNGRLLKTLSGALNFGGISWDLKDDNGKRVTSGIYLYVLRHENEKKLGKIIILR